MVVKIDNSFIPGNIDWKNNVAGDDPKNGKPVVNNIDTRNKTSDSIRGLSVSKTKTNKPENAVKDAITSFGFKQSILQLTGQAFSLKQMLNQLRGSDGLGNSLFHAQRPYSGNTNVLAIRSFNLASLRGADISNLSVDVMQVAQAQRNEGTAMNANASAIDAGFSEGSHHIVMNVNGRDVDIKFDVSSSDSVDDVQRKIALMLSRRLKLSRQQHLFLRQ